MSDGGEAARLGRAAPTPRLLALAILRRPEATAATWTG